DFISVTVSVLLNATVPGAATPSFVAIQVFIAGNSPVFVTLPALRCSDMLDLAVVNLLSNTVSVLLNTTTLGTATPGFATHQDFATGTSPLSVTVGDLNGDGKLDLAVANEVSSTVSVLLNTTAPGAATPSFAAKQRFV